MALFDLMFSTLFPVMFILVFGMIIYMMIGNVKTWNQNNHSPRLTVPAKVVAKRMNVSHHQHANAGDATGAHGFTTTTDTSYYVTFEVESGDRMELHVRGSEYGMLVEGDVGKLSFQGTRYLGFERGIGAEYAPVLVLGINCLRYIQVDVRLKETASNRDF